MNLTPQQKAVGKENFCAAIGSQETRRDFLKQAVVAGLVSGGGLGAFYFGYGRSVARPLRVAVLGTGDEGSVLIGALNPAFVEVTAIADIRPYNVYRAFHGDAAKEETKIRPGLIAKYGWRTEEEARRHVKVYRHYEDLLQAEKDVEAVIIAMPLHLHAPAAIAAMRAGKHVLTEKLMAHSVHECKEMARVARHTGKILAVGHQRHYNILYDNAVDTIRRGLIGQLHHIRAQWHRSSDSWSVPLPPGAKKGDASAETLAKKLAELEKDLQAAKTAAKPGEILLLQRRIAQQKAQIADQVLVKGGQHDGQTYKSAKDYGYQDREPKDGGGTLRSARPAIEELIRWRLWDRTGAGLMAELGSHQLDAASIFIAAMHDGVKQHPLNVTAVGNRPVPGLDRDCEDHVYCILEFPAPGYDPKDPLAAQRKIGVTYSSIDGNGFGGYGEVVFGTKGTFILEKEEEWGLFKGSDTESKVGVSKAKGGPVLDTQASDVQTAVAVGAAATQNISKGYTEEIEHWAWCIRNPSPQNQPRCRAEVALADAVIALTTNMAARKSLRVEFKPEWFDVASDETPEGVAPGVKMG